MKVLKFGAVWCPSCLVMRPRWQKIEKEHPWLKTEYYDYDKDKKMVRKYNIKSGRLPSFIFLDKKGNEFLRLHGEPSEEDLVKIILKNKLPRANSPRYPEISGKFVSPSLHSRVNPPAGGPRRSRGQNKSK